MNQTINIGRNVNLSPESPLVIVPYTSLQAFGSNVAEILTNIISNYPKEKILISSFVYQNEDICECVSRLLNIKYYQESTELYMNPDLVNDYIIVTIGQFNPHIVNPYPHEYIKRTNNYVVHIQGKGYATLYEDLNLQPFVTEAFN